MKKILTAVILGTLISTSYVNADTLTLVDGQSLQGKMISRSDTEVVFEIASQQMKFPVAKVKSLKLDMTSSAPAVVTPVAASKPAKVANSSTSTLPVGTVLTLSINTPLDTAKIAQGHKVMATLGADLTVGQTIVAPKGSIVHGVVASAKKSGRLVGKASMTITFTGIMINNKMYPMQTSTVSTKASGTGSTSVRRTARAAAIGGLVDGSNGAKNGAKIGLGASILTKGNQVVIPAGTMFDVTLNSSLTIN